MWFVLFYKFDGRSSQPGEYLASPRLFTATWVTATVARHTHANDKTAAQPRFRSRISSLEISYTRVMFVSIRYFE